MKKFLASVLFLSLSILVNNAAEVRECLFVPNVSVAAQMPDELLISETPTLAPSPTIIASAVNSSITDAQLEIFEGLWNAVNDNYVYEDFRGHDWEEIGERYEDLVRDGLSDEAFNTAMQMMLNELGDQHSYFQSAEDVAAEAERLANGVDFVGIGALFIPVGDGSRAAIISVFPDSPAAEAGLLPHDTLLAVDGGPIRDEFGISRTRGPEGTSVNITVQRPNEPAQEISLTRRRVSGVLPIDYCMIPNTRIGYLFLPTFLDESIDEQAREALELMTDDAPLDALILDNRMNGGGLGSVAQAVLSLFVDGEQGYFVSRESRDLLEIDGEDINGSQDMPLVVLVGTNTVSYGEIVSGVLRVAGRAQIIGEPSLGNVEQLRRYDFEDGSRAWIASATFEPLGASAGIWEDTGIIPDILVPSRWDLFTEATDPALAAALDYLLND